MNFKQEITKLIQKETNLKEIRLETPPSKEMGDYSFPCFQLSKQKKKSPLEISKELEKKLKNKKNNFIIQSNGPYLNFFIDFSQLTKEILNKIYKEKDKFGSLKPTNKTVLIESPGPNTNKPLHLGHVRNILIGNSLVNLNKRMGNKTSRVDIVNDRGIHICKSLLAYQKFGNNKEPNKKPDHFVGDYYMLYNKKFKQNPKIENELSEILLKWEHKDKKTRSTWKKMNNWAIEGINQTYARFGAKIDKVYLESNYYEGGKEIINKGIKNKIFKKDKTGNIIIDLTKQGLDKKVILRADGTSIYITQDMVLADLRYKDFKMDKMIYVVGNEQIYHFQALFEILRRLGYKFVKGLYHLAYGYIGIPEGRMKSREGTVVDADTLADEMHELAKKEIKKRNKQIKEKELEKLAEQIGIGALKFYILKYDTMKDFTYDPKKSIQFEGETGPYIQYTNVRIKSILKKAKQTVTSKINYSVLKEISEQKIITLLSKYPEIIQKSTKEYKPSLLCNYLISLSKEFNTFYHKCPIINESNKEKKKSRLLLITCTSQVIKNGLTILGIETPPKM